MDLRWMILPVFLVFVEAQKVTVIKAKMGQNAIFTCSGDTTDTFWYMENRSQVKGLIARTYSMDPDDTDYHIHTTVKNKYVAMGNIFEITNLTAEDCRLYFCARKEHGKVIFTDTFHLISDDPITPSTNNNSEGNDQQQQNCCIICQGDIIYSLLALNILFILLTIGECFYQRTLRSTALRIPTVSACVRQLRGVLLSCYKLLMFLLFLANQSHSFVLSEFSCFVINSDVRMKRSTSKICGC
ncbi:uncharacterized protein LOC120554693 isoform X1 [Perca fluviatilis]|uniref:uncharacterized protein LOC120554693 isoform X1 n=1 Tax=Perca fluviatilis TaxID=8168 RepID=UPI0019635260|nr:uncharacterized protein LOC120554693 isoform X1 [Perca fluviatilis]